MICGGFVVGKVWFGKGGKMWWEEMRQNRVEFEVVRSDIEISYSLNDGLYSFWCGAQRGGVLWGRKRRTLSLDWFDLLRFSSQLGHKLWLDISYWCVNNTMEMCISGDDRGSTKTPEEGIFWRKIINQQKSRHFELFCIPLWIIQFVKLILVNSSTCRCHLRTLLKDVGYKK